MVRKLKVHHLDRRTMYGEPEDSFPIIADFWRDWIKARFGVDLLLEKGDVGMMMTLFKIARIAGGYKDDNYRDAVGYLGIVSDWEFPTQEPEKKKWLAYDHSIKQWKPLP